MIRSGMLGCCEMQTCSVKRLPYYARVYYRWHVCMHISHTRPCNINAKDENFLPTAKSCAGEIWPITTTMPAATGYQVMTNCGQSSVQSDV